MAAIKPRGGQLDIVSVATEIQNDPNAITAIATGVTSDPGAAAQLDAEYLRLDGANTMSGDLNMGSQDISNVGDVDGRDISADGNTLDTHVANNAIHITATQDTFLNGLNLPTLTAGEVNYLVGVTGGVQGQINTLTSNKVDKTTQVLAGTGLSGGGALSADVTLSLPNVGTAGTYGTASAVPAITTDAQGRVSGVAATPIQIAEGQVTNLGTSLGAKADKVTGAVVGNFAGLDGTGNLTDSGSKASDFATAAQGTTADSAVQPGDNVSVLTNDAGYLTSFTELDPVFGASVAAGIVSGDITNWNTAYGWGNHASAGYQAALGYTPADVAGDTFTGDVTVQGTIVGYKDNATCLRMRGPQAAAEGGADVQSYMGIFYNPAYAGTGTLQTRAVWGANVEMDAEFQSPHQLRLVAVDDTQTDGQIFASSKTNFIFNMRANAEVASPRQLIVDRVNTGATGAANTSDVDIKVNAGNINVSSPVVCTSTLTAPNVVQAAGYSSDLGPNGAMTRAANTNYTNSTGKPMQVVVAVQSIDGNQCLFNVDGTTVSVFAGGAAQSIFATHSILVPNGSVYRVVTAGPASISTWFEVQ